MFTVIRMASINKQSVREEFDKLKNSFDGLVKSGKVTPESKMLFDSLFLLVGIIMSIFMEKITRKDSNNSSIPPSQTKQDETTDNELKNKQGKNKKDHHITQIENIRTVEIVTPMVVSNCNNCGADLTETACSCVERRTKIDIVFEKVVEHVDAEVKECPQCNHLNKAEFPKDMHGPLQYGNGVKAFVVQLLVTQMISLNRAAAMVYQLIGQTISEATMLSFIMRVYLALEDWEIDTKQQLLNTAVINTDETSLRVNKKNYWIHVYSAGDITLKLLHEKRGKEAIKDFGIIAKYGGIIVHDCWASYLSYRHIEHGLCGSHILRELQFLIDANNYRFAKNMRRLLQLACKMVSQSKDKCLDANSYAKLDKLYKQILVNGSKELPAIPEKTTSNRGKVAKSDAHNLWERLDRYNDAVLLFAKNPAVPFTNNRAERDLRMAKVKQKVSGCFRTEKYAKVYCRVSSYLQTMNSKGVNPLVAISMALNGRF